MERSNSIKKNFTYLHIYSYSINSQVGDFQVFPVLFFGRSYLCVPKLEGVVYAHPDEKF